MNLTIREMQHQDISKMVDYFVNADAEFLKRMGADKAKLPQREEWINMLELEVQKEYSQKKFYYIIWLLDNQPIGHSNADKIQFGESATMHLHLWKRDKRKSGLGLKFIKLTIPLYFEKLELKKLISQPKAENIAPNKTLKKLGFELIDTFETTPGWINFHQTINCYELTKSKFDLVR